jgi:antitoxin component HigA of HigAB toxin-antitoxin module
MKMKNKVKDFEAKSEEWLEVIEEYFTKELENNLTQHKVNEKIMRYKLEAYQKNFLDFIYGVQQVHRYWARMKRQNQGPLEQLKRRKCRLKNHMTS